MIVLLVVYAKKVDWEEVWKVIRDYNRVALLSAVGLVVVSYLIYGCYDLLARFYCGHKLAKRQVMLVSFICYAFNLTLGTWVGGIGMRYRLYSRLGLPGSTITRISGSVLPPTGWAIFYWQGLSYRRRGGVAGSLVCRSNYAAYSRHWLTDDYRGLFVVLRFREAPPYDHQRAKAGAAFMEIRLAQMLISSVNWMVMGAIIWLLLGQSVNYFFVLGVLLVSSIAGVIVHIPAGIGVLEAVYRTTGWGAYLEREHYRRPARLSRPVFFIPLLLALICYLLLESQAKKLRAKNEAAM